MPGGILQETIMPEISAYLTFDGDCAQAMRFYEHALGGKLEAMIRFADAPPEVPRDPQDSERIMHARLTLDGQAIMASDAGSCQPYEGKKGVSLALTYPTVSDAQRVFRLLSENGNVIMDMQPTFWAESFGMVIDQFGTSWLINGA